MLNYIKCKFKFVYSENILNGYELVRNCMNFYCLFVLFVFDLRNFMDE